MRININSQSHINQVSELCNLYNCSPTQLVIDLLQNAYSEHAQGCKENDKENSKNNIHGSSL